MLLLGHRTGCVLRSCAVIRRRHLHQTRCMASSASSPPLVTPQWLSDRLGSVKVLDASWYMPAQRRDGQAEFCRARIPGAQFFDIDKVSDHGTSLPHMLPSEAQFAAAMDALGVGNDSQVVVYDGSGIFSAPRAWWTFRAFGHQSVSVLNGGLPAWKQQGLHLDEAELPPGQAQASARAAAQAAASTSYKAQLRGSMVRSKQQVWDNIASKREQVVDARSAGRFQGKEPEPRPGLPSGHIPGSLNLPFPEVLQDGRCRGKGVEPQHGLPSGHIPGNLPFPEVMQDGRYKDEQALKAAFSEAGVDLHKDIVFSCGTGVTASILALALYAVDPSRAPGLYDGSWTEWAEAQDTPKGGQ